MSDKTKIEWSDSTWTPIRARVRKDAAEIAKAMTPADRCDERIKHIVGFSGGIDSQACARWVLNRYPKEHVILCNSNAGGNEHPLTIEHVQWYSDTIHPVVPVNAVISDMWKTPGAAEARGRDGGAVLDFPTLMEIKGRGPSRTAQFCTEKLKLVPQQRWLAENFGPNGQYTGWSYIRYSGVRRDESDKRKNTPIVEWDDLFDCELIRPLADWTKQMCFDYTEAHGEKVNPLYTLGFDRVGCAPCINSKREDIRNWYLRFPAMIDKIREWEQRVNRTFFPPMVPGMRINWIDDVVTWAMCDRGGKQAIFPVLLERAACESKWGLCE